MFFDFVVESIQKYLEKNLVFLIKQDYTLVNGKNGKMFSKIINIPISYHRIMIN